MLRFPFFNSRSPVAEKVYFAIFNNVQFRYMMQAHNRVYDDGGVDGSKFTK